MQRKILEELKALSEANYKAFNKKIIPTEQDVLGVRLPVLRKIAKGIAQNDGVAFLESEKGNIYEMIMLEGLVLSYLNKSFNELLPWTEKFLDKVDNWAQVDSTVCNYKNLAEEKNEIVAVVEGWLRSKKEFVVRAGLVVLLAHYVAKENLDLIFSLSEEVTHQGYYVHMGNAWLISVCMAKYPGETINFFKDNRLDDKTHNKAIQKSRESYRVSKENKVLINALKRKR